VEVLRRAIISVLVVYTLPMRPDIAVLYLLLRLLALLPLRALHGIGAVVGWLSWRLDGRTARHTAVNIRLTRPQLDADALATLTRAALMESGKSATELALIWGGGARRALKLVREVRGAELFDAALAADKGVIIAAPHLGCWELLNHWLCARTPMAILYRPPRIAALEALLRRVRGDLAPEQVRAEGAGVRTLYKRLAAGGTVGILPDQKPRQGEGQVAPFFGVPALTMVLLPRLAARTGATVLYAFAERLPRGAGFRIHLLPAPDALADTDMLVACSALNRGVEACVERAFAQYQWHYKRFSGHGLDNPYDRPPPL
jgi:KDO2-lipid IV(A) lauroyltransferase